MVYTFDITQAEDEIKLVEAKIITKEEVLSALEERYLKKFANRFPEGSFGHEIYKDFFTAFKMAVEISPIIDFSENLFHRIKRLHPDRSAKASEIVLTELLNGLPTNTPEIDKIFKLYRGF